MAPRSLKIGASVIWRTRHGEFPGEVDKIDRDNIYVLFPTRDHPTGGHWLDIGELEYAHP